MDQGEGRSTVKGLLAEIKDSSELMIDLAYASVFFADSDLAKEVTRLEERMFDDLRELRKLVILSARSPEDAEHMAGVLEIASAVEKIADAAEDIARVVASGLGIIDDLRKDLRHADEIVSRIKVREESSAIGRSLRELAMPVEIGIWVIATRRGGDWDLDPGADYVVASGDALLVKGPEDGVALARELMGAPPLPDAPEPPPIPLSDLDRAVDLLVEMKNSAEVAVGLAYSALLFNDQALADEVGHETIVQAGSPADGRSIKELSVETETGMFVLAVQSGRRWTYRPKPRFVFHADDRIIAIGPPEGGEELDQMVGMRRELAEA